MSATLLDVTAVRSRFTALQRRLAFFDGPGGTQCPDAVIDAVAGYLRHDNANVGAPYETSRRTSALVDLAHEKAGSFLGCSGEEVAFGQSMTALNFLLTRAFAAFAHASPLGGMATLPLPGSPLRVRGVIIQRRIRWQLRRSAYWLFRTRRVNDLSC